MLSPPRCQNNTFEYFIVSVTVFVLDTSRKPKKTVDTDKKRLVNLIERLPITKGTKVTVVANVGDKVVSINIRKPEDIEKAIKQIKKLPFIKTENAKLKDLLKKVKEVVQDKKATVIPVGKLSKPSKQDEKPVKKLLKKLEEGKTRVQLIEEDKQPRLVTKTLKKMKVTPNKNIVDSVAKSLEPKKTTTKKPSKPGRSADLKQPFQIKKYIKMDTTFGDFFSI